MVIFIIFIADLLLLLFKLLFPLGTPWGFGGFCSGFCLGYFLFLLEGIKVEDQMEAE